VGGDNTYPGPGGYPRMAPPRSDRALAYGLGMSSKMARKEITFPSHSVEAIQPSQVRRRKIVSKDLGQVDPWRLLMSLKSGLLAESAWALDTLTILLSDDSTLPYFHLSHLPGLVEVLTDHWRRYLVQVCCVIIAYL
jgi:AT-rich interactive domain-containing protein 1